MSNDKDFFLYELDDPVLDNILTLPEKELNSYIHALIFRFYTTIKNDTPEYEDLVSAYKASFALEKLYRVNPLLSDSYTAIYTKTGLIREIHLDLYGMPPQKLVIN
jgi:hypothetical protein